MNSSDNALTDSQKDTPGASSDRVLAAFAHDLRSPLSSLMTGIEVLKLSLGNPQQADKLLAMMERQTLEIARLVDDMVKSSAAGPAKE